MPDHIVIFKPFVLLLVLLLSTCVGMSRAAEYQYIPRDTVIEPVKLDLKHLFYPPAASAAHQRECDGENTYHTGELLITSTNQIDPYRCIRWVRNGVGSNGTFRLRTDDNRFHQVGFPYLTWVSGNLVVDGKASLDEAYFPRLSWVGGSLIFYLSNAVEYVDTPALTKAANLTVYFRTNNVDLNGQNALTELDYLTLKNDLTAMFPLLNGLQNLQTLGGYKIEGGDVQNPEANNDPSDGGFLEGLTEVDGNVTIETHNMSALYGLGNIHTIHGNLRIHNPNQPDSDLANLQGLEKITTVNGTFTLDNNDSLTSLNGLGNMTVNSLVVTDSPGLSNLSALQNISVNNYGSVTFENLNQSACPDIQSFIAGLNNTISVYNMMNCQ